MCKPSRYYRRRRALPILEGYDVAADGTMTARLSEPVRAMTTRYYFGMGRKRPHNVYYFGGTWYRHVNAPATVSADGTRREGHVHALEPIADELLYNRYMTQTLEQGRAAPVQHLRVRDGLAVEGTGEDGTAYITADTPAEWVAEMLDVA